jgi:lambda family phage minor tail protein L
MAIKQDIQGFAPSEIIEMFELNATAQGGSVYRFTSGQSRITPNGAIQWQGLPYTAAPIEAEGFEWTSQGTQPRPIIRVSNVLGVLIPLLTSYDDLIGAKLIRKRTLAKYLDAANFPGGNPTANQNEYFPEETYFVDRKRSENKFQVELELATPLEVHGVMLPRRRIIANICGWEYRSAECSYAGAAVAKLDDTATSDPLQDKCGKRIKSCTLRFGTGNVLPFGGFPGAGLLRQ